MTKQPQGQLAEYLNREMRERRLSQHALAQGAGVATSTINRILAGKPADPETLQGIALYLKIPPEYLYRLAGMLPQEEELRHEVVQLIEHLFAKLPQSDQEEILDIIRIKVERREREQGKP